MNLEVMNKSKRFRCSWWQVLLDNEGHLTLFIFMSCPSGLAPR